MTIFIGGENEELFGATHIKIVPTRRDFRPFYAQLVIFQIAFLTHEGRRRVKHIPKRFIAPFQIAVRRRTVSDWGKKAR